MKLREWNARLHGLVVFRSLLDDPVVAKFADLTDRMEAGAPGCGPVCDAVAQFEAALFEHTTNWGSYLSAAVLEAETVCVRQAAAGTLAPVLQTALDSELDFLQALCGLTLDELLAWLDANHIPMAVASSSRVHVIEGNLNNWGLTHYFKALVSGQQVKHSKPDPEIFLLAAEKLGTDPAHTLVLEDSYNGVRAGAAGGFVTVMVPDLLPADDEMRGLYTMECTSLNEVLAKLKTGEL